MGPAASARPQIRTADELLAAGDIGRCELVRGELVMMSPAGWRHGVVVAELARLLGNLVHERRGTVFGAETGFVISRQPDTVRAPDVAFIRRERFGDLPDRDYFPGAPDLAVEVLSPDDVASDVLEKVQEWLDAGTEQVWVANPKNRTITVTHRDGRTAAYRAGEELDGGDLLPGLRLNVSAVLE